MTRHGLLSPRPLDALRQLMISRGAPAADDEALLRAARDPRHKLAVTLLSGWQASGRLLTDEQRAELAEHRHRIGRYLEVWPVIAAAAPDAYLVKGSAIAAHYPAGLLRAAGDLDVVCPAAQLWPAARRLIEAGWEFGAFTIVPGRTSPPAVSRTRRGGTGDAAGWHILVELSQPSDTSIDEPYVIELRTADVATSIARPAWRLPAGASFPVAANILALAAERWERPFRSRDIYDLAVLSDRLDAAEAASLRDGLTATGLWPELRELAGLLRRSGLRPAPSLPDDRAAVRRARAARALRSAVRWSHPVRALGYLSLATVDRDRGARADRLAWLVGERIGTRRLLRLGLPLFAVPLPAGPAPAGSPRAAPDELSLVQRGGHLVAVTPVGRFLMVAGACQEQWLAQACDGGL
ncbi:MAG TPA: hypothetical protein VGL63_12035 [Streptosporangiaceae bacterium]